VPEIASAIPPLARLIAGCHVEPLIQALGDLSLFLMNRLNVGQGPTRSVVYTALVRHVFEVSYALNASQLMGPRTETAQFLVYCDLFTRQTVRDLVLSDAITKNFTPGLPLASLFKASRLPMLNAMDVITNPIDLVNYVHRVLGALAQYFGSDVEELFLSFDDTMTLLLALMALAPPANAIGIADCVTMWEPLQVSSVLGLARNYFVCAVEQIQKFGREKIAAGA
jgi:hypothetical protein